MLCFTSPDICPEGLLNFLLACYTQTFSLILCLLGWNCGFIDKLFIGHVPRSVGAQSNCSGNPHCKLEHERHWRLTSLHSNKIMSYSYKKGIPSRTCCWTHCIQSTLWSAFWEAVCIVPSLWYSDLTRLELKEKKQSSNSVFNFRIAPHKNITEKLYWLNITDVM